MVSLPAVSRYGRELTEDRHTGSHTADLLERHGHHATAQREEREDCGMGHEDTQVNTQRERHRGSHRGGLTKRRKGAQGLIVRPLASSGIHWNYNGGPAANFFHNLLFGRPIESHRE